MSSRRAGRGRAAAAAALPDRLAFLGLGLIGGSIVLALRDAGYRGSIAAWSPSGRGPTEALERGAIDTAAVSPEAALRGAGLVILAGPPLAVLTSIDELAGPLRTSLAPGAIITDVASTKAAIAQRAQEARLPFVGGHPMAGKETSGMAAADADLFVGRPWVVDAHRGDGDLRDGGSLRDGVDRVEALAAATGAITVRMRPEEHDEAVASISHLPLVLSAALVEAVATTAGPGAASWAASRALAASGWRDMTRLAAGDPEMGAGILATNPAAVAERLRDVRDVIDAWLADLEGTPDAERISRRLAAARSRLETAP